MTPSSQFIHYRNRIILILLLAVAYFVFGKIGLMISVPPGYATILWPPSGIALAAVIVCGIRVWPGIFMGSFLLNFLNIDLSTLNESDIYTTLSTPLFIASGSTLQAVFAKKIIKKFYGRPLSLNSWHSIATLMLIAVPLSCTIAATVGVLSLNIHGVLPDGAIFSNWVTWWMGDYLGVVFVCPIIFLNSYFRKHLLWCGKPVVGLPALSTLALILTIVLTFYSWVVSVKSTFEKNYLLFENQILEVEKRFVGRFNSYELALKGGAGLFLSSNDVSYEEWKSYTHAVDIEESYVGINGIGWIKSFKSSEKDKYLAWAKENMPEGFKIHPEKILNPDDYYVITYIEPAEKNINASGLDIAFESKRYNAANIARDTGKPALTKIITLVQDKEKTPGFLLFLPLYQKEAKVDSLENRRAAHVGWIYAPFIAKKFLDDLTIAQGKNFHMSIYDGETENEDTLIYDSNKFRKFSASPEYTIKKTLDVEQNKWTFVWESSPLFEKNIASQTSGLILVAGGFFSFILLAFLYSLSQRTHIIQQQVDEKTEELRVQKQQLQFIFDNVPVRIWYKDDKNNILRLNMQAARSMGGSIEDFEGRNSKDFFPDMAEKFLEDDLNALNSGQPLMGIVEKNNPVNGCFSWLSVDKIPFIDEVTGRRTLLIAAKDITKQKLAEDKLKESDERYDLAVKGLSVGLWDWDIKTNKVFWSDLMFKIMGLKNVSADITADTFRKRVHPDDLDCVNQNIEKHLFDNAPYDLEFRVSHENGHYIWVRGSGQATWDDKGSPLRMAGSLEDITSRKYAEEALIRSEELNNLAVRGMSVGLWDWNIVTGEITTSYKIHEILGWNSSTDYIANFDSFIQAIHPDDIERVSGFINKHLVYRAAYDIEFRLNVRGEKYIWVHACGQAKWDDEGFPTRMVGSIGNIDSRKRAEEDLIRSNAELERFAYVASHDLQEPLRMIRNFTQILQEEYSMVFDDQAKQYMNYVVSGAARMQGMVSDLLEYSRLSKEENVIESIDCNIILYDVVENLKQSIEESRANIVFKELPVIEGNESRIFSLLQNLIGNAIKYRHMDVAPEIIVEVNDQNDFWQFSVMDNGIGIKEEYLDQIFILFKRLHRNSEYQGTGIGLAICKKIVEGMGGKIWVESEHGQGSAFYFTIPKKAGKDIT